MRKSFLLLFPFICTITIFAKVVELTEPGALTPGLSRSRSTYVSRMSRNPRVP